MHVLDHLSNLGSTSRLDSDRRVPRVTNRSTKGQGHHASRTVRRLSRAVGRKRARPTWSLASDQQQLGPSPAVRARVPARAKAKSCRWHTASMGAGELAIAKSTVRQAAVSSRFTGVDLVRGGAAGGVMRGDQVATLVVDDLRGSAKSEDGSVTVMVEDAHQDEVTVFKKRVLLVDISSSEEEEEDEEEDGGWLISPQQPNATHRERSDSQAPGLSSVSSWPGSLFDRWSNLNSPGQQQASHDAMDVSVAAVA